MSNVVEFLERMGQDAQLRYASNTEVERALTEAEVAPVLRAAIMGEDRRQLEALLGATPNLCCVVHAPEDDENEPDNDDQSDDDGSDEEDDEPKSYRSALRRVAATT